MKRLTIRGKLVIAIAVAGLVALSATLDSGKAADKNPAKDLVAASVKAMGGEKNARAWTTMTEKGQLVAHWEGWESSTPTTRAPSRSPTR